MITVMGATGHTGKKIAEALLEAGEKVRALGRSESKLASLKHAGAQVLTGDAADAAFLTKAFHGAEAVYTLLPTDQRSTDYRAEQDRQGEAIVSAIRESGVQYVVALSSLGADLTEGTGVIAGLHAQEERLKQLADINVLLLRPVSFFENFYNALELIKYEGINGDSVMADLAIPMVATSDIAEVATKALRAPDWKGVVVRELLGPRDLSYAEATRILGQRIGKPDLQYVQFSYADEANALVQAGMSESFANLYVEMTRAFNEGKIKSRCGRNHENTRPTRFEDFASELALCGDVKEDEEGLQMTDNLIFVLTIISALGCGLIAGAFFAFSTFVMNALAKLPPSQGMAAMQSINIVVINPIFMTALFGTGAACVVLAASSFFRWHKPGAALLLAGGLLYLVGTILVTIVFNVPLNNALAVVDPTSTESVNLWDRYLKSWTAWNHVRTAAALAAAALLTIAPTKSASIAGSELNRLTLL